MQVFLPLFLARSRFEYIAVQIAFSLASSIAFTIFALAPMPYPRPLLEPGGVLDRLLLLEYSTDGPRCTFPSLHVSFAWILCFALSHQSGSWRMILIASASAISVATVLVKQHFIVDVLAGALLAWLSWRVAPAIACRLLQQRAGADSE